MRSHKLTILAGVLVASVCVTYAVAESVRQPLAEPRLGNVEVSAPGPTPSWSDLGISSDELPSPGQCRVWVPGRLPGRQSRAGRCSALRRRVPAGAWLLQRTTVEPGRVRVTVNDPRPVHVVSVRLYEADTGRYIGQE